MIAEQERLRSEIAEQRKALDELKTRGCEPTQDAQRDAQLAQYLTRAEKDNDELMEKLTGERERLSAALKQAVQLEVSVFKLSYSD